MSVLELSTSLESFLQSLRERDAIAVASALGGKAFSVDLGNQSRTDPIVLWAELLCAHMSFATVVANAASTDESIVLTVRVCGDNPPRDVGASGDRQLRTAAGQLLTVKVETQDLPGLPTAVAAYISATNLHDLEALLATFADDALVNDQLRDYWGMQQIRDWAVREIIGDRLTMRVIDVTSHYGHVIVTAHVDGAFDKRGLPDPLALAFYFSARGDRIVQLIILRNQAGT